MSHNRGDVDIDFADRDHALQGIPYVAASIYRDQQLIKHNTGVYFHAVPVDPVTGLCSLDYKMAAEKNCYKIDLLNVGVYEQVRDEAHLLKLMNTPLDWNRLYEKEFCEKLFHISNHNKLVADLKPSSIIELATVLALIRPSKKHLINKCKLHGFDAVQDEVWTKTEDDAYFFKKSHAIGYSHVVVVHANLLIESEVDQ